MKIKTSELNGKALDWAVAQCERFNAAIYAGTVRVMRGTFGPELKYSVDWAQGGPIIEREKVAMWRDQDGGWLASTQEGAGIDAAGETPLQAAMRCYVVSKLGEEVNVPEELI